MEAHDFAELVERLVVGGDDARQLLGTEVDDHSVADLYVQFLGEDLGDGDFVSALRGGTLGEDEIIEVRSETVLADDAVGLTIDLGVVGVLPFLGEVARDAELLKLRVLLIEVLIHIFCVITHDLHGLGNAVDEQVGSRSECGDQVLALHGVGGVDQHQDEEHAEGEGDHDGDVALRAGDRIVDCKEAARTGSFGAGKMELAFLGVALAGAAGSDRVDRGGLLNDAGSEVGESHDGDDDEDGADGVDAVAEGVSEDHVLCDGAHKELAERDAQDEAEDGAGDGHREVLREVQGTDLSVLDADGFHDADLSVFSGDREGEGDLQDDEGEDDQADGKDQYDKGNDHVHDVAHGDGVARLCEVDALALRGGFLDGADVVRVDAADLTGVVGGDRFVVLKDLVIIGVHQDTGIAHEVRAEECVLDLAVDDETDGHAFLTDFEDVADLHVVRLQEAACDVAVTGLEGLWCLVVRVEEVECGLGEVLHDEDVFGLDSAAVALLQSVTGSEDHGVETVGVDGGLGGEHIVEVADAVLAHRDDDKVADACLVEVVVGAVHDGDDVVEAGTDEHRCQCDEQQDDQVHGLLLFQFFFQNAEEHFWFPFCGRGRPLCAGARGGPVWFVVQKEGLGRRRLVT